MPTLPNRLELEETFASKLGRRGQQVASDVIGLVGDPPRALTADEWASIAQRYGEVIQPQLETIYQGSAGHLYDVLGVGRDDDAIGSYAQRWARQHTDSLMQGVVDNSRTRLDALLTDYADGRVSAADFRTGVRNLFSPARAEMIAATETTRAAAVAEEQTVNGLRQYGLQFVATWQTANDDLACPLCGPLNGRKQGDGWTMLPPVHPRCRCTVNYAPINLEG